jgi:hypothetical protein
MSRPALVLVAMSAVLSLLLCSTLCVLGVEERYPIPVACLLAFPAVWPGAWAWHYYRQSVVQRRLNHGQCVHCGYDLRATRDRCPECGEVHDTITS